MLYLVEVPEAQMKDLSRAVGAINPRAKPPIAVGMDENRHVALLTDAQGTYEYDLQEILEGSPPWEDLGEKARMAVAAYLAGFIDWQFEGGSRPDYLETLPDLLREHPELGRLREQ